MNKSHRVPGLSLLVVIAALSALYGCGGSPAPVPTSAVSTPAGVDSSWKFYDHSTDGFTLSLPPNWLAVDLDPTTLQATLDQVKQSNATLADLLSQRVPSVASGGARFFAVDTQGDFAKSDFLTNLNIILQTLPGQTDIDTILQNTATQIQNQLGDALVGKVESRRVKLGEQDAARLDYTLKVTPEGSATEIQVATTQYIVLKGTSDYILTFSTTPQDLKSYAGIFDKIAQTFTAKPSVG